MQHIFEKIFHPDVIERNIVPFQFRNKKTGCKITLREEANKEKKEDDLLYEVSLEGFDKVHFAINFDKYKFIHGSKNEDGKYQQCLLIAEHIRKACDNIIWANFEGKDIILMVELKSKNNQDILPKFKSTKLFLSYLKSLLDELYGYKMTDFIIIPLLINTKRNKNINKINNDSFTFFQKAIKNNEVYYIKHDFQKIIKTQPLNIR